MTEIYTCIFRLRQIEKLTEEKNNMRAEGNGMKSSLDKIKGDVGDFILGVSAEGNVY